MPGIHTERRKGEVHINTRKTIKSFSGLSHLSILRLSEVRLPPSLNHCQSARKEAFSCVEIQVAREGGAA